MIETQTATNPQQIGETYDRCSPLYDLVLEPWLEAGRSRAMQLLAPRVGDRILELGVGTGLSLEHYPWWADVVALDYSAGMLKRANRRLQEKAVRCPVRLAQADAQRLPFPDGAFDRVLAAYVLTVVADTSLAVRELLRVVRPGGQVVLINHLRSDSEWLAWLEDVLHPLFSSLGLFTLDRHLLQILDQHGIAAPQLEPTSWSGLHHIISFSAPRRAGPGSF